MNSQCIIHAGRAKYYIDLGKEDYYTNHVDPRGRFMGRGADHFTLQGEAIERQDERFKRLMKGETPDGKEQMRRGGNKPRQYKDKNGRIRKSHPVNAIDNTFSAPKDVSLLWGLGDEYTQDNVLAAHQKAVAKAVESLDTQVYTRTRPKNPDGSRGDAQYHKGEGIFAVFDHFTSRELDPQLHSHVLLLNATVREDGEGYGAVDGKMILKARYVAGQLYLNTLRHELEQTLGVDTFDRPFSDEKGVSFGINGVTQEVKQTFSKRSMQIETQITPTMTASEVRSVKLTTRKVKVAKNVKVLMEEWRETGAAMGFSLNNVLGRNKGTQKPKPTTTTEQIHRDVAQKLVASSDWKRRELEKLTEKREVLKANKDHHIRYFMKSKGVNRRKATSMFYTRYNRITARLKKADTYRPEYFQKNTVLRAVLATNRTMDVTQAQELADGFLSRYANPRQVKIDTPTSNKKKEDIKDKERTEPVYELNYKGYKQAQYRTTREKLIETTHTVLKAHAAARNKINQFKANQKAKGFNAKLTILYATGKITRKQYLEFKEQKHLQYSEFKLVVYEALGLMSHRHAKAIRKQKEYLGNPYRQISIMQQDGRINEEEARLMRIEIYQQSKAQEQGEAIHRDTRAIEQFEKERDVGRERKMF